MIAGYFGRPWRHAVIIPKDASSLFWGTGEVSKGTSHSQVLSGIPGHRSLSTPCNEGSEVEPAWIPPFWKWPAAKPAEAAMG